jgi:hypothetical protein
MKSEDKGMSKEVIAPTNVLTPRMLELMADPLTKEMGLIVKLVLKDGSKRKGIYKDLVLDPLKRYEYKDDLFVMLEQTVKEHDTIYTPISQIATIDWAY